MTREEAIAVLRREIEPSVYEDEKSIAEAVDMAIEALSAEESVTLYATPKATYIRPLTEEIAIEFLQDSGCLVRCKDCKWYMLTDHSETEVCTNKQWDISMAVYPIISENDFCSYGERREE